jgi:hypothetical protein
MQRKMLDDLDFEHVMLGAGVKGYCGFCKTDAVFLVCWPNYGTHHSDDWLMCTRCARCIDSLTSETGSLR